MSKWEPPDRLLTQLTKLVNDKVGPSASVSFATRRLSDDVVETMIVFQAGDKRAIVYTKNSLAPHDAQDVADAINDWREKRRTQTRWMPEED